MLEPLTTSNVESSNAWYTMSGTLGIYSSHLPYQTMLATLQAATNNMHQHSNP
jgi:hypothetical protein